MRWLLALDSSFFTAFSIIICNSEVIFMGALNDYWVDTVTLSRFCHNHPYSDTVKLKKYWSHFFSIISLVRMVLIGLLDIRIKRIQWTLYCAEANAIYRKNNKIGMRPLQIEAWAFRSSYSVIFSLTPIYREAQRLSLPIISLFWWNKSVVKKKNLPLIDVVVDEQRTDNTVMKNRLNNRRQLNNIL